MASKVVLGMMLNNESENVLYALASVAGLYDAYVIGFDDKSHDGTKEIVLEYFKDKEIPGVFYEFTWRNDFSWARNQYLDLALEHFPDHDWIIIFDGDDLLSPGNPEKGIPDGREQVKNLVSLPLEQFTYKAVNFYVYLDPDHHGIPSLFYPRVHMIRNLPEIRFQFASHNAITVSGDDQILVRECVILHHQKPKKRAEREVQRVEMNIPNLIEQGDAGTTNDNARGLFYLGNTLLDSGDHDGAEKAFLRYLEISEWNDERYQARIHLCGLYLMNGKFDIAETQARQALVEPGQWSRAEGYMIMSDCCLAKGDAIEAIHWLLVAVQCKPQVNGLFLQGHLYTWFPHWRLALLFDRLGCYNDAIRHAELASQWRPDDYILNSIMILREHINMLQRNGKEISSFHNSDSDVQLYQISEADVLNRLGVA